MQPFYNPLLSYEENYGLGPFGAFAASQEQPATEPTGKFLGYPVCSTIGIPAGPLLNSKYIKGAFNNGFDLCVYKTVRSKAHPCLPLPNILRIDVAGDLQTGSTVIAQSPPDHTCQIDFSITNSFGVPSQAPEIWQEDMARALGFAGQGQIMIASFQGSGEHDSQVADYGRTARMVVETGAEVLEANLSCPNEGKAGLLCYDPEKVNRVVDAIRKEIGKRTLMLKIGYFEDDALLAQFVELLGHKVQGICAINTLPAHVVNKHGELALPGRETSGICGASIRWAGLAMARKLKTLRSQYKMDFAIVAGGGVFKPKDDTAYRKAGADAVMTATGAMWNPHLALEIKKEK